MLYFALYLLIGLTFTKIVDVISAKHLPPEQQFTDWEKFTITALWPINLIVFIYQFIKTYIDLNKNK